MNDRHQLAGIGEASRVSATNVRIGHIVPALGYALADSLNAPLRIIQTNVEEPGEEGSFQRRSNRIVRPVAGQSGFDSEALGGSPSSGWLEGTPRFGEELPFRPRFQPAAEAPG